MLNLHQIASLMYETFWQSSDRRPVSACISTHFTRFVIIRHINCTSSKEQNSTKAILKGANGGRNLCGELTHKIETRF
jgi:hypothetical protein